MRPSPAPLRSRTRGARTATGPRPVMIARSGRWPWRTSRWRPSSVCLSAWPLRKAATSASTACASRARAPSRRTSVSGSENSAGWISLTTLSWIMACHSFGGEVEARTPPRYAASTPHAVTNFRAYLRRQDCRDRPRQDRGGATLHSQPQGRGGRKGSGLHARHGPVVVAVHGSQHGAARADLGRHQAFHAEEPQPVRVHWTA